LRSGEAGQCTMPINASTCRCACRSTSLLRRRASSSCARGRGGSRLVALEAEARGGRRESRGAARRRAALGLQRPAGGGGRTRLQVLEVQAAGLPRQVLEGRLLRLPVVGLGRGQGDLRQRRGRACVCGEAPWQSHEASSARSCRRAGPSRACTC
jgi:hypothetical protein